ncbi:MAG: hypothetical protein LBH62_01435 [Nitrososphaerota archaeon]|jgi:type IV secretory pathway TraG/TraD family ATPase VirD4|nr:hypothetical protein [Nitrososphaerota archaeon]
MGFELDSFSSLLINFIMQMFTNATSAFMRLFGRKPKNPYTGRDAEQAAYTARNPPANKRLTSPEPRGVFFGARGSQYVVKTEDTDGHVLVCGGTGTGKSSCVAIPTLSHSQQRL